MRIPSTRGLSNLQQLDRAVREQKHGERETVADALMKSRILSNPDFSGADHNRKNDRRIIDFMI